MNEGDGMCVCEGERKKQANMCVRRENGAEVRWVAGPPSGKTIRVCARAPSAR